MKNKTLNFGTAALCFLFVLSLIPIASFAASGPGVTVKGTISVASTPTWDAYNPANKLMYVVDSGGNELSIINSVSSPKVVATLRTGSSPWGATPTGSSCGKDVAVANSGGGSVSLYKSTSPYALVTTIKIPSVNPLYKTSVPREIAYAAGVLYVADGAGQIDVINCATRILEGSVLLTAFSSLNGAFYDSVHKIVYFADEGASSVWYFDLSGNEPSCEVPNVCLITSIGGNFTDSPAFFAEDTAGNVYFTDSVANSIRVINLVDDVPTINATQYGNFYNTHEFDAPVGIAFNPVTQEILVANTAGSREFTVLCVNTVSAFCASAGVGGFHLVSNGSLQGYGLAYDPANHYVYATNENSGSVSYLSG